MAKTELLLTFSRPSEERNSRVTKLCILNVTVNKLILGKHINIHNSPQSNCDIHETIIDFLKLTVSLCNMR